MPKRMKPVSGKQIAFDLKVLTDQLQYSVDRTCGKTTLTQVDIDTLRDAHYVIETFFRMIDNA